MNRFDKMALEAAIVTTLLCAQGAIIIASLYPA
jgi:hypothetical protein